MQPWSLYPSEPERPATAVLAMVARGARRILPRVGSDQGVAKGAAVVSFAEKLSAGSGVSSSALRSVLQIKVGSGRPAPALKACMLLGQATLDAINVLDRGDRILAPPDWKPDNHLYGFFKKLDASWTNIWIAGEVSRQRIDTANAPSIRDADISFFRSALERDFKRLRQVSTLANGGWLGRPVDPGPTGPFGGLWPGWHVPHWYDGPSPEKAKRSQPRMGILGEVDTPNDYDVLCIQVKPNTDLEPLLNALSDFEANAANPEFICPVVVVHCPGLDEKKVGDLIDHGAVVFDQPRIGRNIPTNSRQLVVALREARLDRDEIPWSTAFPQRSSRYRHWTEAYAKPDDRGLLDGQPSLPIENRRIGRGSARPLIMGAALTALDGSPVDAYLELFERLQEYSELQIRPNKT